MILKIGLGLMLAASLSLGVLFGSYLMRGQAWLKRHGPYLWLGYCWSYALSAIFVMRGFHTIGLSMSSWNLAYFYLFGGIFMSTLATLVTVLFHYDYALAGDG